MKLCQYRVELRRPDIFILARRVQGRYTEEIQLGLVRDQPILQILVHQVHRQEERLFLNRLRIVVLQLDQAVHAHSTTLYYRRLRVDVLLLAGDYHGVDRIFALSLQHPREVAGSEAVLQAPNISVGGGSDRPLLLLLRDKWHVMGLPLLRVMHSNRHILQ